jgi:hypothetical protein
MSNLLIFLTISLLNNKILSINSDWLNNKLLINKNKPIIYVPGLAGSVIFDENNKQIWPPNLYSIISSNNFEKKISIKNTLEPLFKSSTAPLFNTNKNGSDKYGIKINNGDTKYFISNKFGEHILEYFYKKSHPVYAFPYDFRIVPNFDYITKLKTSMKESIEQIYKENSEQKIVIVAHSLGSLIIMNFFNNNTKDWIDKYIDVVICINPPFNGSIIALKTLLENNLHFYLKNINLNWLRNFGGLIWCLPDITNNKIILNIDGKDITKVEDFLYPETLEIYKKYFKDSDSSYSNRKKINPNIKLHIIKSYGVKTPSKLYLKSTKDGYIFDKFDYTDGDGIITNEYKDIITDEYIKNNINIHNIIGEHSTILQSNDILNKISEIIK